MPVGRALEPGEGALESAGRVSVPAGRALKPGERGLESAGRPFEASWETRSQLGARGVSYGEKERKNRVFLVCGGTVDHHPI